ncbi:MAG TPA: amidohydrolase, partial [Candidatus Cloacimonadota bacterium]|nr:amidohydrolase [Candidatus Cloacimonadota bacterium]
ADMDGLPFNEETNCGFESKNQGWMHACGHDIHMTVLLGLIEKVTSEKPKQNLLFLFQPAEEGHGGALRILDSGILDAYQITEVYALHVSADLPVGTVSSKPGIIFAIPQEYSLRIYGQSAHAAFPQQGKDALMAGVQVYSMMQQSVKKLFSPVEPVIFHVGHLEAGRVCNAIADSCLLEGTHRTLTRKNHQKLNELLEKTVAHVTSLYDMTYDLNFTSSYDPVLNNDELYGRLKRKVNEVGYQFIEAEISMTGEDFGFFTSRYSGVLFWLGTGIHPTGLHSSQFLPDEKSIEPGVQIMFSLI